MHEVASSGGRLWNPNSNWPMTSNGISGSVRHSGIWKCYQIEVMCRRASSPRSRSCANCEQTTCYTTYYNDGPPEHFVLTYYLHVLRPLPSPHPLPPVLVLPRPCRLWVTPQLRPALMAASAAMPLQRRLQASQQARHASRASKQGKQQASKSNTNIPHVPHLSTFIHSLSPRSA